MYNLRATRTALSSLLPNIMPHHFDMPKIKLPKGERTFSGDIILERRGGKMWDDLKKWLEESQKWNTLDKMNEIEKQYGIDYTKHD
jgi:hypothetical protein